MAKANYRLKQYAPCIDLYEKVLAFYWKIEGRQSLKSHKVLLNILQCAFESKNNYKQEYYSQRILEICQNHADENSFILANEFANLFRKYCTQRALQYYFKALEVHSKLERNE